MRQSSRQLRPRWRARRRFFLQAHGEKLRYLLVGGWNTAFAYGVGVWLYQALSPFMFTWKIAAIANVLTISMSFLTYKLLVFRTQGHWLREYLRSYAAYSGLAILGISIFTALVDGLRLDVWLAQGLTMLFTAIASYFTHKKFTFRKGRTTQ